MKIIKDRSYIFKLDTQFLVNANKMDSRQYDELFAFGWDNIPESHKVMVDEFEINDLPGLK